MCEPKLRTPGTERSSLLPAVTMRRSSVSDVPGFVSQCIRKSRSLNSGNSDWPSSGTIRIPVTTSAPSAPYAGSGRRMMGRSMRTYPRCITRVTGDSLRRNLPREKRITLSAGVTVIATTRDTCTASA